MSRYKLHVYQRIDFFTSEKNLISLKEEEIFVCLAERVRKGSCYKDLRLYFLYKKNDNLYNDGYILAKDILKSDSMDEIKNKSKLESATERNKLVRY